MSDVFGQLLTPDGLEDSIEASLRTWFPTYLREIALQNNLAETFVEPQTYDITEGFDTKPPNALPSVMIITHGTEGTPEKDGEGYLTAWFRVSVSVIVSANSRKNTRRNS